MSQDNVFDEAAVTNELLRTNPDLNSLTSKGYQVSQAPLLWISNQQPVGTSYLVRYEEGVLAVVKSEDLEPGTAVTLWWVFFNVPENCEGECDAGDLVNVAVKADMMGGEGHVIDGSGKAVFTSHRKLNDVEGTLAPTLWNRAGVGIEDASKAVVHLVLRTHGPLIPEMEEEMTTTFNGGCQGFPAEVGEPGPNTCANIQGAIHLPGM